MRFVKTLLTLVAVAGMTVAGTSHAADTPKRGGTLRVGHQLNLTGFDPFVVRSTSRITSTVFTLFWHPSYQIELTANWSRPAAI